MFYTFLTQCSATASFQFLYRSDKVFFSFLFKEAFQHYIHTKKKKKNQDVQYETKKYDLPV